VARRGTLFFAGKTVMSEPSWLIPWDRETGTRETGTIDHYTTCTEYCRSRGTIISLTRITKLRARITVDYYTRSHWCSVQIHREFSVKL